MLNSITVPNAKRHLQALQAIANANGGTRASGTPGFTASRDYVGAPAGVAYDVCYHQACDTITNINDRALLVNMGAIAHLAVTYAFSNDLPGPDVRPTAKSSHIAKPAQKGGAVNK